MSLILGYLSLGFLLYLIFTRFAPAKNAKNDTENIEMMPTAVPKISGISKRALFAQGWSQKGHGIWDPNAPKSDQKSSKNSIFDIKKLISILRVARYLLDVLWGQPIKLIQVASNSELRENQWNDLFFFEIVPCHCFGASEVQT